MVHLRLVASDRIFEPRVGSMKSTPPKLVAVRTPKEVAELQKRLSKAKARYERACEQHTRMSDDVHRGEVSQAEMDAFHEGEFTEAEQEYEAIFEELYNQPPAIQAAVFGWE